MNNSSKNKWLTWLVVLLLIANVASIALFWFTKEKHPPMPKGGAPRDFLVKELGLDSAQQLQLDVLVKDHRQQAEKLRQQVKAAKEAFFELLKQPAIADSTKQAAAKAVSAGTEELDLLTFNHFQKIRALCTPAQQQKFDNIMQQVTSMIAQPRPPMGPGGPPPGGPGGDRPPPDGPPGPPPGEEPPPHK